MPSVLNSSALFSGLLARIRGQYLEMPGMRLTEPQVQRLCGIDPANCQRLLDALVEAQFLCLSSDRYYMRREGRVRGDVML